MKRSPILSVAGTMLFLGMLGGLAIQRRQLSELRTQAERQAEPVPNPSPPRARPGATPEITPLSENEKLELLRLRGQVALLRASAAQSSASAKRSPPSASKPANLTLPEGYQVRSQFKLAGYDTPEHTFESFLWAAQNRDTNVLLQAITADAAKLILPTEPPGENGNPLDEFVRVIPGFRVHSRVQHSDARIILKIQNDPRSGSETLEFPFERIDGVWKMSFQ